MSRSRATTQHIDPDADLPKRDVPLYRLPRGLRRRIKEGRKDEGRSSTGVDLIPLSLCIEFSPRAAQQIVIEPSVMRPETKFYDIMSKKILSTVYRSDHPYEQAMIMGKTSGGRWMVVERMTRSGENVHKPTTEPGVIVLSERVQFNKVLQKRLPPDPDSIASSSLRFSCERERVTIVLLAQKIDGTAAFDRKKPARGFRRWKALPEIRETVVSNTIDLLKHCGIVHALVHTMVFLHCCLECSLAKAFVGSFDQSSCSHSCFF